MDCPTGLLIDFDNSPKIEKPGIFPVLTDIVTLAKSSNDFMDDCFRKEFAKDLCASVQSNDHHSPKCECLVDLDFSETSYLEKDFEENLDLSMKNKVKSYNEGTPFYEQNVFGSETFLSSFSELSGKFGKRLNDLGNTPSTKRGKRGINCSWSPAKCSDVDLLENEKFDFSMSISPYKARPIEALLPEENGECTKCSCKKDKQDEEQASNIQNSWSMFSAPFIPEVFVEASGLATELSSVERNLKKTEESLLSSTERDHTHSSIKERQTKSDNISAIQEFMENISLGSETQASVCSITDTNNDRRLTSDFNCPSTTCLEQYASRPLSPNVINDKNLNLVDKIVVLEETIALSQTEFMKSEINSDSDENSSVKSKEDIIILITDDKENSNISKMEHIFQDELSTNQNECVEVQPDQRATSPLIRKETFTIKPSPLRETNFKTPEIKSDDKKQCVGSGLKKQGRNSVVLPGKVTHLTPVVRRRSICAIKTGPSRKQKSPLSRKETTHAPSSPKSTIKETTRCKTGGESLPSNCSTPVKLLNRKSTPVVSRDPSILSRISRRSLLGSPSVPVAPPLKKKSPKAVTGNSSSKTSTVARKLGILPTKLNLGSHSSLNTDVPLMEMAKAITPKSTPNMLSKTSASISSFVKKKLPIMPHSSNKCGGNGAAGGAPFPPQGSAEFPKRNHAPLKAVDPLSHMVKASDASNSTAARASNVGTNIGKTLPSTPRGISRNSSACSSPSVVSKRSSSVSTPKCASTPIKSRFLSQSETPTPVSVKKNAVHRRRSLVPAPKSFTPKRFSDNF